MRQGRRNVEFGDDCRSFFYPAGVRGSKTANFLEYLPFESQDLLFGIEHLGFELFELWRGEALGVGQGLLAFVSCGDELQIRSRDLDVIAENIVEAYLKRLNAGLAPFPRLNCGDMPAAIGSDIA